MNSPGEPEPRLQLRGIVKRFPGVLANDQVDLTVMPGEIHALLGENGAGKSTLVKMIYGVLQPDAGELFIDGRQVAVANPAAARALGVGMVFQHFSLFEALTVADNIALGLELRGTGRGRRLRDRIAELSERYGLALTLDRGVHQLSAGEKQRIEIVRCLLGRPRLLIMDEPTSVLTPQESEALFNTLRRLADEGCAVLYISHKLDEVQRLCRRATVLRQGRKVAELDPSRETAAGLAALMVGSELRPPAAPARGAGGGELLRVDSLTLASSDPFGVGLHEVGFTLAGGEIIGIAGVAGNGQAELLAALSGERLSAAGCVTLNGVAVGDRGPQARRRLGLGVVPEDRLGHATAPGQTLAENALLTGYVGQRLTRLGWRLPGRIDAFARRVIARFGVRSGGPAEPRARALSLSGGNLQKFIVGREIEQRPRVLAVAQPTWGVDAGAEQAIHQALLTLAGDGAGIVLISQDLDELLALSHRVGALCAGRLSELWPTAEVSRERLGLAMAGAVGG